MKRYSYWTRLLVLSCWRHLDYFSVGLEEYRRGNVLWGFLSETNKAANQRRWKIYEESIKFAIFFSCFTYDIFCLLSTYGFNGSELTLGDMYKICWCKSHWQVLISKRCMCLICGIICIRYNTREVTGLQLKLSSWITYSSWIRFLAGSRRIF